MKRKGYLFERICGFDNLLLASKRAFKGSGRTQAACQFQFYLERELLQLKKELKRGLYRPGLYRYFRIFDPKERTISVAPFRDRVVHHALVQVLEPIFDRAFIYDSYATRKGKGTHKALIRSQEFLKRNFYFLKTDIFKYFDTVDHQLLMDMVRRKVKDERTMELVGQIIHNSDVSRGVAKGKGLPVGNLTSQFFANVYLDPLDHYLKDEKRVRCYIRYMDDMVVFSNSRECLKEILEVMRAYAAEDLHLALNQGVTLINSRAHGLPFLGFRVFPSIMRVNANNLKRIKKRLHEKRKALQEGLISEEKFVMSVRSMFDHLGFANTLTLRRNVLAPMATIL